MYVQYNIGGQGSGFETTELRVYVVPLLCVHMQPCTRPLTKKFMFSSLSEEVCGVVWCGVVWCGVVCKCVSV